MYRLQKLLQKLRGNNEATKFNRERKGKKIYTKRKTRIRNENQEVEQEYEKPDY